MVSTRNTIFYGLNFIRILSIVGLILVFSSSILVMVTNIKAVNAFQAMRKSGDSTEVAEAEQHLADCDYIHGSTVPNQAAGVFWAVVSSLLILFQSIILIMSEIGWPKQFFNRFFPVLGSEFGVGALGIFQCLIGAQILSHHVDNFTLVAAFFAFVVGCINILVGLIFRESAKERRCIAVWQDGSKPILPTAKGVEPVFVNASPAFLTRSATGASQAASFDEKWNRDSSSASSLRDEKVGYGFGRQGEKAAGLRGFYLQRPEETLPRYASPVPSSTHSAPFSPPGLSVELPEASPALSQKSAAIVSALARNKSIRTSTSSFASPDARRNSSDDFYASEDEDLSIYDISEPSTPVMPVPLYIASPHEDVKRGRGASPRPMTPPDFKSSTTAL